MRPRAAWTAALAVAVLGIVAAIMAMQRGDGGTDDPASSSAAKDPTQDRLQDQPARAAVQLGLMTGLPLYWPIDAGLEQIAQGTSETPWFRSLVEGHYELIPLDTLSPGAPLDPAEAGVDPLAGLERLAIVQPRGISPQDNVALDRWVRDGGHLLLALDPQLSGHYDVGLTDPRHPSVGALIPPVVARWGLALSFDGEAQDTLGWASPPDAAPPIAVPVHLGGIIQQDEEPRWPCRIDPARALARCAVGAGFVTLLADAAVFEHRELAGEKDGALLALLDYAFAMEAGS